MLLPLLPEAGAVVVFATATELDAILQVVGALGMARFLASNLLFAKDREATLANVRCAAGLPAFRKDLVALEIQEPQGTVAYAAIVGTRGRVRPRSL